MAWAENDVVTIYYPKATKTTTGNIPDIGIHEFKSEGNNFLNHNIINI